MIMRQKSWIWVTHNFEGFHKYPDAPEEVSFLRDRHRHIFHLKIWINVFHDDREIEFFMFKNFIKKLIENNEFNFMSCEMISDELWSHINQKYPGRDVKIEVSEDNENGSYTEYTI